MKNEKRQEFARRLVSRMGYAGLSSRVGTPNRIVVVKETVSQIATRVFLECDAIMGRRPDVRKASR